MVRSKIITRATRLGPVRGRFIGPSGRTWASRARSELVNLTATQPQSPTPARARPSRSLFLLAKRLEGKSAELPTLGEKAGFGERFSATFRPCTLNPARQNP